MHGMHSVPGGLVLGIVQARGLPCILSEGQQPQHLATRRVHLIYMQVKYTVLNQCSTRSMPYKGYTATPHKPADTSGPQELGHAQTHQGLSRGLSKTPGVRLSAPAKRKGRMRPQIAD